MDQLNPKQRANLEFITNYFNTKHSEKYIKGAKEHNSILSEFSEDELLDFAMEEILDLMSYVATLIQKRRSTENY